METNTYMAGAAVLISLVAIVISFVAIVYTHLAWKEAKRANEEAKRANQISLHEARKRVCRDFREFRRLLHGRRDHLIMQEIQNFDEDIVLESESIFPTVHKKLEDLREKANALDADWIACKNRNDSAEMKPIHDQMRTLAELADPVYEEMRKVRTLEKIARCRHRP